MKKGTGKKQTGKRQDAIVPAQAGENYPMEDRALKEAARFMGEDLRRFRAYEAVVSYKYGVDVCTYVVCTAITKVIKSCLVQGKSW